MKKILSLFRHKKIRSFSQFQNNTILCPKCHSDMFLENKALFGCSKEDCGETFKIN